MTKVEKDKCWKPEFDERYYGLDWDGHIFSTGCGNDDIDEWCFLTGNYFKTEKEAKEYRKQIKYIAQYKNYIEKHSEPIDWRSEEQGKYFAYFSYGTNEIGVDCCIYAIKNQGTIYASSEQIICNAIQEIGEKNFKKYILEVK